MRNEEVKGFRLKPERCGCQRHTVHACVCPLAFLPQESSEKWFHVINRNRTQFHLMHFCQVFLQMLQLEIYVSSGGK